IIIIKDFQKLYDIFEHKTNGPVSISVIEKLQSWNLLAREGVLKCNNGHYLKLYPHVRSLDGFSWSCRAPINKKKKNAIIIDQFALIHFFINRICHWSSFHREVVFEAMITNHNKIDGVGQVVEIDESKFGRRKYNHGHRVDGQWIFGGGFQRETGACFLIPVEKRDKDTLLTAINDWILPGTTIISYCWKSYQCLEDERFVHLTVNHSIQFKNPETGAHTNNVEGMWRHAKASLSQYCRKKRFYGGYLAKFMFLKRCRILNIEPLTEFFKLAGELYDPKAIQENNLLLLSDGEESSETDGSDEDLYHFFWYNFQSNDLQEFWNKTFVFIKTPFKIVFCIH
ncbi:hypothetical protein AGLY_003374, partial [Aphis glycines]